MPVETVNGLVFELERLASADWKNIHTATALATTKIGTLRDALSEFCNDDANLVVFGSLARGEFTSGSDIDWTLLVDGISNPEHLDMALAIEDRLDELGEVRPGAERTFGRLTFSHDLVHYIGGQEDTNANTTRRILLLLESAALGRETAHRHVILNVLSRYLSEDYGWKFGRGPSGVPPG